MSLLPTDYFEDEPTGPAELDALVAAVHGGNQIVDDKGVVWGVVGSRHGMSAYARVARRRGPFRFLYRERNTILFGIFLGAFLWALLFWL